MVVQPGGRGRITQPVLAVRGEKTAPTFAERLDLLAFWLPNVEHFQLAGATHLLHLQNSQGMARGLASFYARHALEDSKRAPGLRQESGAFTR